MMKKWIPILSGLLVLQLVLAVTLNLGGRDTGAYQAEEPLLAFEEKAVDGLRIEDGKDRVVLGKRDGKWFLPENGDFPASTGSVDRLLDALSTLEKGWPVATTGAAIRRFRVDGEAFERKLTLLTGEETVAELYVGTSPGFRKVHVRSADEDAVFAVAFNSWEASAQSDEWIDRDVLTFKDSDVVRIEMPGFVLHREGDALQVADLADNEESNAEAVRDVVGKLSGLRIESLLGTGAQPAFRQDEPELQVTVTRDSGDVLSYRFSRPQEGAYYVLKRSDFDHYFKVAEFTVQPVKDTSRETLVQTRTVEVPAQAASDEPDTGIPTETAAMGE